MAREEFIKNMIKNQQNWNLIEGECKSCHSKFLSFPSRNKRFCSISCGSKGNTRRQGIPSWNKGLKGYRAGEKRPGIMPFGEKHWSYKGDKVKYRALHMWVETNLGKPNKCSKCGKTGYGHSMHWANKSRLYQHNLTDWLRLCVPCHKAYDRTN